MIRNLIFDFGQVLIRFEPDEMIRPYVSDQSDRALLADVVFDRAYWDRLDNDSITDEELLKSAKERLPRRLQAVAETVYRNWYRHLPPVPGMWELARRMKETYGVRVFVLSNISRGFAAHAGEFPILREADGCLFSALCGFVKPDAGIFGCLCDTYGLDPAECLFIDDNPRNVAGSEAFGIRAYRFDGNVPALEAYLQKALTCPDT